MTTPRETSPGMGPSALLLANPRFLTIWLVGWLTGVVRWLQLLVLGIYTFQLTGSPLLVSVVPMLWMLPLALCGPLIGVLADTVSRKLLLCAALSMVLAVSVTMALAASEGDLGFHHIVVTSLLSGVFWATDMPVRRRLLGDLAGEDLVTAMSLDSATSNATRMAGPFLGGLVLQLFSLTGVFVLSALAFAIGLLAVVATPIREPSRHGPRRFFVHELVAGIRFVVGDPNLRRIFSITIIFNVWGFPFTSMIPVIGTDRLALEPVMLGLLSSTEGLGAFTGAVVIALAARRSQFNAIYVWGTTVYLALVGYLGVLSLVAGGPLHSFLAACATLLAIGLASACFAAMQSTLSYLSTPPEYRSRVLGVLTLCIGTGPIGFLHVGWLAETFGAPVALIVTAAQGLFAMLLLWVYGARAPAT